MQQPRTIRLRSRCRGANMKIGKLWRLQLRGVRTMPLAQAVPVSGAGCGAITRELCRIVWPGKFKPDLPRRYDDIFDPLEFLQLYSLSIKPANGDDKLSRKRTKATVNID